MLGDWLDGHPSVVAMRAPPEGLLALAEGDHEAARRHCNRCSPRPTRAWRNRSSGHCGLPSPRRCSPTATEVTLLAIRRDRGRFRPLARRPQGPRRGARPPAAGRRRADGALTAQRRWRRSSPAGSPTGSSPTACSSRPRRPRSTCPTSSPSSACRPAPRSRRGPCVTTSRRGAPHVGASFSPGWSRSPARPRPSAPRGGWSGRRRACRAGSRRTPAGSRRGCS